MCPVRIEFVTLHHSVTHDFVSTLSDTILVADLCGLTVSSTVEAVRRQLLVYPKHSRSPEISNKFDQQNAVQMLASFSEDGKIQLPFVV